MKKTLLIAVATVMVALGANAQVARVASKTMGYAAYQNNFKLENVMAKEYQSPVSKNLTAHRAAPASIEGDYILNADNFDGSFTASTSFSVVAQSGTITLDQYDEKPSFDYNVVLNDFSYAGAVVYGNYNAEQGFIEIPVQTIATHATYKEIVISGGYRKGEENVGYGKEIILIVNEDGSMDIDEDIEEEGDLATTGWVSFLPNYEDGGLWNYGFDIAVLKPNATMSYATTGKSLGGNGTGWAKVQKRVNVEDYGTELVVNGFLGLAPVTVTVNEDGTCMIPFGQNMDDHEYEEPYGIMHLVGCYIEGNSIGRDPNKKFLNGSVSTDATSGAKLYEFYKSEYKEAWTDEEGEHKAGYYYIDDDPDYCRYYAVASNNDSDGRAYSMGFCCNTAIETDPVQGEGAGISDVKTNAKSTVKTYNLMGQEVNASAKGLIIRDGKKMLNK